MAAYRELIRLRFLPSISKDGLASLAELFAYRVRVLSLFTVNIQAASIRFICGEFNRTFREDLLQTGSILGSGFVLTLLRPTSKRMRHLLEAGLPRASSNVAVRVCLALAPNFRVRRDISNLLRVRDDAMASKGFLILRERVLRILLCLVTITRVRGLPVFRISNDRATIIRHVISFRLLHSALGILSNAAGIGASRNFCRGVRLIAYLRNQRGRNFLVVAAIRQASRLSISRCLYVIINVLGYRGTLDKGLQDLHTVRSEAPALIVDLRNLGVRKVFNFKRVLGRKDRFYGDGLQGTSCEGTFKRDKRLLIAVLDRRLTRFYVFQHCLANFIGQDIVIVEDCVKEGAKTINANPVSPAHAAIDRVGERESILIRRFLRSTGRLLTTADLVATAPFIGPSTPRFEARLK